MTTLLHRRSFLGGLLAAPAVVAFHNLMPIKGIKFDPMIRLQSWPLGTERWGEWWVHEGPLSTMAEAEKAMRKQFGVSYWETKDKYKAWDALKDYPADPDVYVTEEGREYKLDPRGHRDQFGVRETQDAWKGRPYMTQAVYSAESCLTPKAYAIKTELMKKDLAAICKWGT